VYQHPNEEETKYQHVPNIIIIGLLYSYYSYDSFVYVCVPVHINSHMNKMN